MEKRPMKGKTKKKIIRAFKAGYLNGVYWTCHSLPFVDDQTREKIVMWFEDMSADALVRRYGGEEFEKLTNSNILK